MVKLYNGQRRYCTLPNVLGVDDWFTHRFNDLCKEHDDAYKMRTGKWKADKAMLKGMIQRGHFVLAFGTFIFFMTAGFFYYYTK